MDTYDTIIKGKLQENLSDSQPKSFERRTDGRKNARKSVGSDKVLGISASSIANGSLNFALLNVTQVAVTVAAGQTSGTSSVVSGGKIMGYYPTTNQDQTVKGIAISGTTLTLTLLAAATADNHFIVNVFAP